MRSIILLLFAAVSLQAQNGARYTATSANVSGAGEAIKINLTEWSTDSRRDEFVAAWTLTAAAPQGRGGRGAGGGGGAGRGGGGRGARGGAATTATPAPAVPDLPVDPDTVNPDNPTPARGRGGARGGGGTAVPAVPDLPVDPDTVNPDNPAPARGRGGARGGGGTGASTQTPEASLAAALKRASTVGILWTSENVGYSIKYAYRLPEQDGGERIILATDRRVGAWSNLWQPAASITPSDYSFSIIELHVNSRGEGEGRGVMAGKVSIDAAAKTIALDGYATQPTILKSVKRQLVTETK